MKIKSLIVFPLLTLTFGLAPDFFAPIALAQNNSFGTQATPPGVTQGKTDPCSNYQVNGSKSSVACCLAEYPDLNTTLDSNNVSNGAVTYLCADRKVRQGDEELLEKLRKLPPIPGSQ
jgi:hypothetical protein